MVRMSCQGLLDWWERVGKGGKVRMVANLGFEPRIFCSQGRRDRPDFPNSLWWSRRESNTDQALIRGTLEPFKLHDQ